MKMKKKRYTTYTREEYKSRNKKKVT